MIQINKLHFQYKKATKFALKKINMQIAPGDFVGIIGNSGAGKTTLLNCMNGIVPHYHTGDFYGAVTVDGMDTVETVPETLALTVGSVLQDVDAQMVASIVEDELLFGLENFGVPRAEIAQRLTEAMEATGIKPLRYRNIATLSGGQKQKVAIASILALRPKVLLLDEPTGELDPQSSRMLFETLRTLNETYGMTIVIVEQKIMLLCEFVKKLAVLEQGELVLFEEVKQALEQTERLEQLGIHMPRIAYLRNELHRRGLYDGAIPLHIEEAKQMVEEVLA